MNGDDETWMQTYTGRQFWPLDPRVSQVHIEDIAHSLAVKCRYGGHCIQFYSVAQHSLLVAEIVSQQQNNRLTLTASLHDAAEAYTADIIKPIKKKIQQFEEIENKIEQVIAERFSLIFPFPPCIKEADNILLATERRDLMAPPPRPWKTGKPAGWIITPWTWEYAEERFLEYARKLI